MRWSEPDTRSEAPPLVYHDIWEGKRSMREWLEFGRDAAVIFVGVLVLMVPMFAAALWVTSPERPWW